MVQFEYIVKDKLGFHARIAGGLVKTARQFRCRITMESKKKKCDLKDFFICSGFRKNKCDNTHSIRNCR